MSVRGNETTRDLIINDEDYTGSSSSYYEIGCKISESLTRYIAAVRQISKLTEGKFSDNLCSFADTLEAMTSENLLATFRKLQVNMNEYIARIDDADGYWN